MFPYKFVIHLILLLLTAWVVLIEILAETAYTAQLEQNLNQLFLSTDPDAYAPPEIMASNYVFDVVELRALGTRTIDNYFALTEDDNPGFDVMEPLKDPDTGKSEPIKAYLYRDDGAY